MSFQESVYSGLLPPTPALFWVPGQPPTGFWSFPNNRTPFWRKLTEYSLISRKNNTVLWIFLILLIRRSKPPHRVCSVLWLPRLLPDRKDRLSNVFCKFWGFHHGEFRWNYCFSDKNQQQNENLKFKNSKMCNFRKRWQGLKSSGLSLKGLL